MAIDSVKVQITTQIKFVLSLIYSGGQPGVQE